MEESEMFKLNKELEKHAPFEVIDLEAGESHGHFATLDEARGCVAFDKLVAWEILRHGVQVEATDLAGMKTAEPSLTVTEQFALGTILANPHTKKIHEELVDALRGIATAARSWHDFHCGSEMIGCDEICAALPKAEAAYKKVTKL
jgi:hypothetical protein